AYRVRPVGFGEAINVSDLDADFLSGANHRWWRRRGRRDHPQPGLEANAASRAVLGQGANHHRRATKMGDAFLLDKVHRTLGDDLRQADMAPAHRGYRPRETPAVAVEHGQRPEIDGAAGEAVLDDLTDSVHVTAAMGVHHALGIAGGAAGVVDGDDVVLANLMRHDRRVTFAQELLVVDDDALEAWHLAGD